MMVNDLLVELGCEELPSRAVLALAEALKTNLCQLFSEQQLSYGEVELIAAPRRIGLIVKKLQEHQADQRISKKGPALAQAYDENGNPTKALQGFMNSCGARKEDLSILSGDKGDWVGFETVLPGVSTVKLLPNLIEQALEKLPIAKPMRWGDYSFEFVRPVHWVVLLYGQTVVPAKIMGLQSGQESLGHRFHHPERVKINSPSSYKEQMRQAYVLCDFQERKAEIIKQSKRLGEQHKANIIMPEELVDEVTSIVEWPCALLASFSEEFLEVPQESLIASMQVHQKCFALQDKEGHLLPKFITIANIESKNPGQVIAGNEKVMHARLSDAAFFYHQDRKLKLSDHRSATGQVVFAHKLGTLLDKSERMVDLMNKFSGPLSLDAHEAQKAAELSKCDLMTGMVGEFPELQGLMGYYYALHDKESAALAVALNEQYMPRFAADAIPETPLGKALSLADRLDTLVGIFAIDQKPTGVKDPFKCRRHALAVIRILESIAIPLPLSHLLQWAMAGYKQTVVIPQCLAPDLKEFIMDRIYAYYQTQGVGIELIHAVKACQNEWIYDFKQRITALSDFVHRPEMVSLASACKRVNNLLSQAQTQSEPQVDEQLLGQAEKSLLNQIQKLEQNLDEDYEKANYAGILNALATLKQPVDDFFEQVMVMVEDPALRANRLALLRRLQTLLMGVADISQLVIGSPTVHG